MHRLALSNAWRHLHTSHHVCQDIENKHDAEQNHLSWDRERLCRNAQHTAVTRPLTNTLPTTKLRTSVGNWPARKAGSISGGLALMPPIPRGAENGLRDPSTPRPARQNTSYGPSCPCTRHDATTARAVMRRPSCTGLPSTGSSRYPHDAPFIVFYAATARR